MTNLGQLMKQAQAVQTRMAELQDKLGEIEIEGTAAAGMVKAIMNGKGELKRIKIDPTLVDGDEIEVLEDLVVAACADAKGRAEAVVNEEMRQLTGGLPLPPGMKLF